MGSDQEKMCEWCGKYPAQRLKGVENGPMFGLTLEGSSADYCTHECWESQVKFNDKIKEA